MKYKKYIAPSVLTFGVIVLGGFFSYMNSGGLYVQYQNLWNYRRLHPDIIPPTMTHRMLAVGHDTTYADIMWLRLIQFIGDNILNGRFIDFSHKILVQVQDLHPRFARAYQLDLLLLPTISSNDKSIESEKKRQLLKDGLRYYDHTFSKICDMHKVSEINELGFGENLWSREDLRNPCIAGSIPYYIATRYDMEVYDKSKAVYYYKIASMHDDAPSAARFLGVLAYSSDGNYRDGALTFALMATNGYDTDPYSCQQFSEEIALYLADKKPWTEEWIDSLMMKSQNLSSPPYDPLKGTTCYESIERSLKQIYLGYITELTQDKTDIITGDDILDAGLLPYIPTVKSQSGYTVSRKTGIWQFRQNMK